MIRPISGIVATVVALGSAGVSSAAPTTPYQSSQRATVGSGLGQSALPSGNTVELRVEAATQYVANVELTPSGTPQVDLAGIELAPGFYASHSTESAIAVIDYSLIGRFWDDSDYDDISHLLSANGEWFAVPEWFSLRGQASYTDAVIDARKGVNFGDLGIFSPGNLAEVATAAAGPVLRHRFNELEFNAEYTYGRVWYLDEGKGQPLLTIVTDQDSEDQSASVSVGTFDRASRASARVFYDWQRSEYEVSLPYQFERTGLEAGYRFGRTMTLLGDVGLESDIDESTTEGGLDSDFWSAGLRWDPSDRTSVEARYGQRFFGDTYLFSARHRARLLEFDASYTEAPTVESSARSLGAFEPGELPPGLPNFDFSGANSTPYVGKSAQVGVTSVGSRTTISLSGYYYERDYVRGVLSDETRKGVELTATRQLASNLSIDGSAAYSDFESVATSEGVVVTETDTSHDTQLLIRLNRTAGSRLTLGGETGYLLRSGGDDAEGWWVALRARWVP